MTHRILGLAGEDALYLQLPREFLRVHGAIAVHEDDERFTLLDLHHEGLHDLVLGDVQRGGGGRRAAVFHVLEDMLGELHALLRQELRGRSARGFHR